MAIVNSKRNYRKKRLAVAVSTVIGVLVAAGIITGVVLGINYNNNQTSKTYLLSKEHSNKPVIAKFVSYDKNGQPVYSDFAGLVDEDGRVNFNVTRLAQQQGFKLVEIVDSETKQVLHRPEGARANSRFIERQSNQSDLGKTSETKEKAPDLVLQEGMLKKEVGGNNLEQLVINFEKLPSLKGKILTATFVDKYGNKFVVEQKIPELTTRVFFNASSLPKGVYWTLKELSTPEQGISLSAIKTSLYKIGHFLTFNTTGQSIITLRLPKEQYDKPVTGVFVNIANAAEKVKLNTVANADGFVSFDGGMIEKPGNWKLIEVLAENNQVVIKSEELEDQQKVIIVLPTKVEIELTAESNNKYHVNLSPLLAKTVVTAVFKDSDNNVKELARQVPDNGQLTLDASLFVGDMRLEKIVIANLADRTKDVVLLELAHDTILRFNSQPSFSQPVRASFDENGSTIVKMLLNKQFYANKDVNVILKEVGSNSSARNLTLKSDNDGVVTIKLQDFVSDENKLYEIERVEFTEANGTKVILINEQTNKQKLVFKLKAITPILYSSNKQLLVNINDLGLLEAVMANHQQKVLNPNYTKAIMLTTSYLNKANEQKTIVASFDPQLRQWIIDYSQVTDVEDLNKLNFNNFNITYTTKSNQLETQQPIVKQIRVTPIKQRFDLPADFSMNTSPIVIKENGKGSVKLKFRVNYISHSENKKFRVVFKNVNANEYIMSDEQNVTTNDQQRTLDISKTSYEGNEQTWKVNETYELVGLTIYDSKPEFDGSLVAFNELERSPNNVKLKIIPDTQEAN